MTINLQKPDITELKPRITVFGVGGGGGNAVNNMIAGGLEGVDFVVANTDAQALTMSRAERVVQMGVDATEGLGAGSRPEIGKTAAEECLTEITDHLSNTHMAFVTAGMGGGTGTGAAPVVARAAREMGVLTVGVVTKPFHFEGQRRMKTAEAGIIELQKNVDTLIVIPNQNLFRIANDKTTFADAFGMADQVLYSGVACITDLMVKEGLINLDFADVRSVMNEMGKAMMGTGEASGDGRAMQAAEAAISNPLLDESSMRGAQGLLISITGGRDMTLFEVDEAATRIREEVDSDANIILGATFDEALEGTIRVSVVATGIDNVMSGSGENATKTITPAVAVASAASVAAPITPKPIEAAKPAVAKNAPVQTKSDNVAVEKDGVRLESFKPQSTVFSDSAVEEEFRNALEEELMPKEDVFVPAAAEVSDQILTTPTIPAVEDFPPMVKAEFEAKTTSEKVEETGALGLLKKIKTGLVGASEEAPARTAPAAQVAQLAASAAPTRVEDKSAAPVTGAPVVPSPQSTPSVPVSAASLSTNAPQPRAPQGDSPYAPKRTGLDTTGRIEPETSVSQEEDQLDIPAFLRRQAN